MPHDLATDPPPPLAAAKILGWSMSRQQIPQILPHTGHPGLARAKCPGAFCVFPGKRKSRRKTTMPTKINPNKSSMHKMSNHAKNDDGKCGAYVESLFLDVVHFVVFGCLRCLCCWGSNHWVCQNPIVGLLLFTLIWLFVAIVVWVV